MAQNVIILRQEKSDTDIRHLSAKITQDGDLLFSGWDLGDAVEAFFGSREYEWDWRVKAADVPLFQVALGGSGDLLADIALRFSNEMAADLYNFLQSHQIPYESWSRIGD